MRVIVAGTRWFSEYGLLESTLAFHPGISRIISGGTNGAEALAEHYAREYDIPLTRMPGDDEMMAAADMLIAFWDGQSPGTGRMIDLARRMNLQVHIVMI